MRTGEGSDKKREDSGFSLIELLVVLSIIMTMTGITVIGMGSYRGKITERQTRNVADELLLTQNAQQNRPGNFKAGLYQEGHSWYVIVSRTMDEEARSASTWLEYDRKELGSTNSLRIADDNGGDLHVRSDDCYYEWRFDRETGACIEGAGSIRFAGAGKSFRLTVYEHSGRSEVRTVYE